MAAQRATHTTAQRQWCTLDRPCSASPHARGYWQCTCRRPRQQQQPPHHRRCARTPITLSQPSSNGARPAPAPAAAAAAAAGGTTRWTEGLEHRLPYLNAATSLTHESKSFRQCGQCVLVASGLSVTAHQARRTSLRLCRGRCGWWGMPQGTQWVPHIPAAMRTTAMG